MLFFRFKNYEEFKEIFGIVEHGNGVKSRKNKILLALYKDKRFLKMLIYHDHCETLKRMRRRYSYGEDVRREKSPNYWWWHMAYEQLDYLCASLREEELPNQPLNCDSLVDLKYMLYNFLQFPRLRKEGAYHEMRIGDRRFFSDSYETDCYEGLCEDKTLNAIRYVNLEKGRTFKMKAGKMFNHIMSCNKVLSTMPEQIQRWLSEEFVAEWIEYSRKHLCESEFTLHVDDHFSDIYNSECCAGYDEDDDAFGSCMVNDDQYTFYKDAVNAKAAYLTDCDGMIVARCVIFTDVHENGSSKIWRLAERQYSKFCDLALQRQLVRALIEGGHIDGYKRVGASCHEPKDFLDIEGKSLADKDFWIPCNLSSGDTISYQDSFKYYDPTENRADNYGYGNVDLSTTEETVSFDDHEDDYWSDYHDCYISDGDAVWVASRNDYFYENETVYAKVKGRNGYYQEDCLKDDCLYVDGDYYYAGDNAEDKEDYGIGSCSQCGDYFIIEDGYYSDLLEEYFDCEDCMDAAEEEYHKDQGEAYSDYDEAWYDEEDVLCVWDWDNFLNKYYKLTISIESFNNLVEEGEATIFCGEYFIDNINYDGEPVHEELLKVA